MNGQFVTKTLSALFRIPRGISRAAQYGGLATTSAVYSNPLARMGVRAVGLGAVGFGSAHSEAAKIIMNQYPRTYSVTGFGSGFGLHGKQMPYDGGIGATGDLVLGMRTHGRF